MAESKRLLWHDTKYNETKQTLLQIIIKYTQLPQDIAIEIVEFLPSQSPFIKFNPTWYDKSYSFTELLLIIINNIIHYTIIGYLSIQSLLLRFAISLPLIESLIIMFLYYSNIRYVKTDIINQCTIATFTKLYSFLEICCYIPFLVLLFVIDQTGLIKHQIAIYLLLGYFSLYFIMKIYQYYMYHRRQFKDEYTHFFHKLTMYYLLIQSWILFIYGMIISSSVFIIMASVTYYIGLISICKASRGYWFDKQQPKYIIIIYIQNICFGVFSMQLLFTKWNEYPIGYIMICIITTILQSIHSLGRHFIDKWRLNRIKYVVVYLLPDVLMTVNILSLSLFFMYNQFKEWWGIIWYVNIGIIFIVQIIKDIYLWMIGDLDNKLDFELWFNIFEHGVYTSIFGIWGIAYIASYSISRSIFLTVFASISTGIACIGWCCMSCCIYIAVQEFNQEPGMYPAGYMS